MQVISVGVREAKTTLSKLLKSVQRGREVIITDRGRPVGKIIPVPEKSLSLSERIKNLEKSGWIESSGARKERHLPPALPVPDEIAQRFLREDRYSDR